MPLLTECTLLTKVCPEGDIGCLPIDSEQPIVDPSDRPGYSYNYTSRGYKFPVWYRREQCEKLLSKYNLNPGEPYTGLTVVVLVKVVVVVVVLVVDVHLPAHLKDPEMHCGPDVSSPYTMSLFSVPVIYGKQYLAAVLTAHSSPAGENFWLSLCAAVFNVFHLASSCDVHSLVTYSDVIHGPSVCTPSARSAHK